MIVLSPRVIIPRRYTYDDLRLYYKIIFYPYQEVYSPNTSKTIKFEDSIITTKRCICLSHYDLYNQNMRLCSYNVYDYNFIPLWINYVASNSLTVPANSMHIGVIYTSN